MGKGHVLAAIALSIGLTAAARAQDAGAPDAGAPGTPICPPDSVGCHAADVDFHHEDVLFESVMLDSGWVPPGAPLQVRFAVFLGGSTEVDLGGTAVTSWPPALGVTVPGRPGTGRLAFDYGIEIVARIRIDVNVGGAHYTWEGNIPIPGGIPRDLRLASTVGFDPFVLPPSDPRPVVARDETEAIQVLNVDLTDALVPLPGIGGGFLVDAVASLEGSYRTERIEISDAVAEITTEGETVVVRADPGAAELGAFKEYTVLPRGTIGYDGVITLFPRLYVEVAGSRFELTVAEVPLRVVDLSAATEFEPALVHVPLPDVRVEPSSLDFGTVPVLGTAEQLVTISNDGEAELTVRLEAPAAPFAVSTTVLSIPPRSSTRLAVRFQPASASEASALLSLATNDPDEPHIVLHLRGRGAGESDAGMPDAGLADAGDGGTVAGGCGCRSSRRGPSGLALALPILALSLRRRRA